MPSSSLHIVLYNWLQPFLEEAKRKGFHVSPDTHIQIASVLRKCADKIEDETVLFDYVSPLIAKNKEDYQLLKSDWEKWCGREKLIVDNKIKKEPEKRSYHLLIIAASLLIILSVAGLGYYYFNKKSISANYVVSYTDITQPVQFDASSGFKNIKDTSDVKFIWNYGDGSIDTSAKAIVSHLYKVPQLYNSSLTLLPVSSLTVLLQHRMKTPFLLCKPKLVIVQQPEGNIITHQQVNFSVLYDSSFPSSGKNTWRINGKLVAQNESTLTTQFDSTGTQTISYTDADYNGANGCDSVTQTTVTVKSASTVNFNISQVNSVLSPPVKVNYSNIIFFFFFILFLYGKYLDNLKKIKGRNNDTSSRSDDVMAKLNGTKPPYEIPFKSKDDVIDDEPLLPALAKNFKRRIADENVCLNIPLTIDSTIRSEGFLLPVFTQKTKPSEYLILTDKTNVKSAQVKLFEYLIRRFTKSDIYIDTFYFYEKPDVAFNAFYPKGIYVSRLYDLYPDHTVIIFGNGHSFIDKYYPALTEATTLPYTKWATHAIFTPVPYADWGGKEILLQKRFLLLPADMEWQLLLFTYIDNPETFTSAALQSLSSLYKTKGFNVNKVEKIKQYLADDFLFQWLCSLAISSSIYWQTMLGIGDALQKERYRNEVIEYSCLLKLARISWMRDATFPEEIRLELLKNLEPQNEKIARQTMIRMMEEASLKMNENSFAYEELYLQQLTDKFMLYANDADNEEFANYKAAHDEFKALWKDDKITDSVLREYLKKEEGGDWSTLIGNETLSSNPHSSISIDSLFDDKMSAPKRDWLKLMNTAILALIFLIVLFAASIFLFENKWNHTYVNDRLELVSDDTSATISFMFHVLYNQCLNNVQRQHDSTVFTLDFGDNNLLSLNIKDTSKQKKIPYAWLNKRQVGLHISSRNDTYIFDSSFVLASDQFSVSMNGCAVYCNQWTPKESKKLSSSYSGDWYENSIVNGTNTAYKPLHIEPNSVNGEPVAEVSNCANNNQLLRIITKTADGGFGLYYLSQTQAGSISFDQHNVGYTTLAAAEKDTAAFTLSTRIALLSNPNSFANSRSFFTTFNGRWKTDDSADVMDISPTQNTITLDNKYTFTVSAEQQTKTTWGRPLYKLSILQNGAAPNKKPFLYLLLLDSTRGFISGEEQDTGAVQYSIPNMGTFQLMHKQQTTAAVETPATLPQSLNEIWHGGTNNRLINIFLPKNVIYYSVNDTKTFGTYNINTVSLLSDGTYKIITKTDEGYKLFFIKNVSSTSFGLSVCQNFLTTKEEAIGKTAASCDAFNNMSLYYENDPSAIYLPVSFSNNLVASQKAKLNNIVTAVNNKTATVSGFDVRLSYTPPNIAGTVNSMNSFLQKNGISNKITAGDINSSVVNRPFTRSYIDIKTSSVETTSLPVQNDGNNEVKQVTNIESNLGTLQLDAKSGMPDSKSLQLIAAVASQLKKDTASRIRLTANYSRKEDYATAQQQINTIENLFKKEGVAVSRADNPLQIVTLIQIVRQAATPRQNQQSKAASVLVNQAVSIVITGVNFPADFISNASKKAD